MLHDFDPEVVSSYAILLVSIGLVGGVILEYTRVYPGGTEYGVAFAGLILVVYGVGASFYYVFTPDTNEA
jgi:hypothetical protein